MVASSFKTGLAGALCFVLAACEGVPKPVPRGDGAAAAAPARTGGSPGEAGKLVRLDPKRLVGLDETAMTELLGKPESVREEAPARVWNYRLDGCSLDVFFYLDLGSKTFRALTYDVKTVTQAGREDAIELCVGRIQTKYRG